MESHRHEVREAIVDAAAAVVRHHGLLAVTMSQIAETAGIGRATLYKYFSDVEEVLAAWHHRQTAAHLDKLAALRDQPGTPAARLRSVLEAYGRIWRQRRQHGGEHQLAAALHRDGHADRAQRQVLDLVAGLITEAAAASEVRSDIPPDELASYCIHATEAAGDLAATAGLTRLLDVIWSALTPGAGRVSAER